MGSKLWETFQAIGQPALQVSLLVDVIDGPDNSADDSAVAPLRACSR
jgi:hypothetical protein